MKLITELALAGFASVHARNPGDYLPPNNNAQAWTNQGYVQGTVHANDNNVMSFNGIPYAAAPVGYNRWKKPQDAVAWDEDWFDATRDVSEVVGCMNSIDSIENPLVPNDSQSDNTSEDCLFVNIVTPSASDLQQNRRRPVLVHVHGAGFERLTGSNNLFNGNFLAAEEGAIVVTFNYRLGVFGYLSMVAAGEHVPGNQAVWDVLKLLEWVKENIEWFGGDPDNVTLMGESSGAHMVSSLMAMKPNAEREALFHRAILLSTPWMIPARVPGANLGNADHVAGQLLYHLGCGQDLMCAFQKSTTEILVAAKQVHGLTVEGFDGNGDPLIKITTTISAFTEVVDGVLFDMQTFDAFKVGRVMDIDVITGSSSGEGTTFLLGIVHSMLGGYIEMEQMYDGVVQTIAKDDKTTILGAYPYPCFPGNPFGTACNSQMQLGQFVGDYMFTCPNFFLADEIAEGAQEKSGRLYNFLFDTPVPSLTQTNDYFRGACTYASCHGAALPYIFGSFDKDKHQRDADRPAYTDTTDQDWALSARMRKYWGNFLWSGNPNDNSRDEGVSQKNVQDLECWADAAQSVDCAVGSDETFVKYFTAGTDPYFQKGVGHFRNVCEFWKQFDVWMKY